MLFRDEFAANGRPAGWDKLRVLKAALDPAVGNCSLALWLDADAVVLRPVQLVPLALSDIVTTIDFYGVNTGVLLLRRGHVANKLLKLAWKQTKFVANRLGAEQSAVRYVLQNSKELRRHTTVLENLVKYPTTGGPLTSFRYNKTLKHSQPFFHAAGCTMGNPPSQCAEWLMDRADAARRMWESPLEVGASSSSCLAYADDLSRPRGLRRQDMEIPWGQGRDAQVGQTDEARMRERAAVSKIETLACMVARRKEACVGAAAAARRDEMDDVTH